MQRKHVLSALAALAALSLLVAACGGGDDSSSGGGNGGSTTTSDTAGKDPVPGPGFDGTTINLGVISPLSGIAQIIGTPLTSGNDVYWQAKNAKGGVAGKYKVSLDKQDSAYDPNQAGAAFDKIAGNVAAFQQILGTAVTEALIPKLDARELAAGPATLDSEWLVEDNMFPIATTYQIIAINALDYYVNEAGGKGKVLCQIAQDDAYGQAGVDGINFAATQLGVTIASTQRYGGGSDKSAQVQALKDAKCDFVFGTVLATDTNSVITKAVQLDFAPQWALMAPAWLAAFAPKTPADAAGQYMIDHVWVGSSGPEWGSASSPGMQQMLADVAQYAPTTAPDLYFAFGYAQAWAMDQILEKAVDNGDLSPKGIIKAIALVDTLKFGGLVPDFTYGSDPATRQAPPIATIFKIAAGAPGGLTALSVDYTSDAAKEYRFK